MELRKLNGEINRAEDKIVIGLVAPDGREILIRVPKSLVKAGLKDAWPDGGETGIYIDVENRLRHEANRTGAAVVAQDEDDLDMALAEQDEDELLQEHYDAPASSDDLDDLLG